MTADGIFTKSPTDMEHGKSQCACDPPMMDESHVLTFLFTSYRVQLERSHPLSLAIHFPLLDRMCSLTSPSCSFVFQCKLLIIDLMNFTGSIPHMPPLPTQSISVPPLASHQQAHSPIIDVVTSVLKDTSLSPMRSARAPRTTVSPGQDINMASPDSGAPFTFDDHHMVPQEAEEVQETEEEGSNDGKEIKPSQTVSPPSSPAIFTWAQGKQRGK